MPCFDGRDNEIIIVEDPVVQQKLNLVEAFLCGVLTVLENRGMIKDVFDSIDLVEAGYKQSQIERWWDRHKEEDKLRLAKENAKIKDEISELEKSINQDTKMLEQLRKKLK